MEIRTQVFIFVYSHCTLLTFSVRFLGLAKTGAVREGKDTSAGFRQKLVELLLGETGGPVKWGKIYVEILFFAFCNLLDNYG